MTREEWRQKVGEAIFAEVKKYPLPPPGLPDGSSGWGARPVDVGRAALDALEYVLINHSGVHEIIETSFEDSQTDLDDDGNPVVMDLYRVWVKCELEDKDG